MNIRFLESFLCITEENSVAAAARRLHVTATAIAQQIKALEDELGIKLISRTGRTMKVTAEGWAILPKMREVVSKSRELKQLAGVSQLSGELRIGVLPSLRAMLIPDVIADLHQQFPQLTLSLETGFSCDLYQKITEDKIDLALLVSPLFPLNKEFCWQSHHQEKFVVVAPASLKNRDSLDLLRTQPFICYHQKSWGGIIASRYLQALGIGIKKRFDINALENIILLVDKGYGISLIPNGQPLTESNKSIITCPLPEPAPCRDIGLLYRNNSPLNKVIHSIADLLIKKSSFIE